MSEPAPRTADQSGVRLAHMPLPSWRKAPVFLDEDMPGTKGKSMLKTWCGTLGRGLAMVVAVCAVIMAAPPRGVAQDAGAPGAAAKTGVAIFAGGCFWCVEADFDKVPGVLETVSGFIGGTTKNPSYKEVVQGGTGHLEAVRVTYDPLKVSYAQLLGVFWRSVDPTDAGGQFCDRGEAYTTAIFALDQQQRREAEQSKAELSASQVLRAPIVTPIRDAGPFYPAEDYHQDYYKKNPVRYRIYRYGCGRDARVREIWGAQAHAGIPGH
jgi:peptide-methionine (S)-S-oxide reductase